VAIRLEERRTSQEITPTVAIEAIAVAIPRTLTAMPGTAKSFVDSVMTRAIDPGPLKEGMASGIRATSMEPWPPSGSCTVLASGPGKSMRSPMMEMTSPPAMRSASREIPKNSMTRLPTSSDPTRIMEA